MYRLHLLFCLEGATFKLGGLNDIYLLVLFDNATQAPWYLLIDVRFLQTMGTEWQTLEHIFRETAARVIGSSLHSTIDTTDAR